ncbi:Bifunctional protein pyrR [Mycovorax composti]|jgi:Pyrimidine operon attenuation protein/uracil phosphoribosyltransferase|uniref:Bifunctional protein pyrR n=1 Tax=Mycovorax composti TaxID=2962693 RepID=A0ABZ2EJ97_9BACT
MAKEKKYILSSDIVNRKLSRLALEIIEGNMGEKELVFVGIESTGVILAKRLQQLVEAQSVLKVELLTMSMNKQKPEEIVLSKELNFDNKVIVIIDDVTNTGKTLLYAMKPFLRFHPRAIQTLVLVERSYTQFPIRANYKGYSLATTFQEHITVEVEGDNITGVYLS